MKRFWSDELQDEISRLTGLCVEQQDAIGRMKSSLSARARIIKVQDARIEGLKLRVMSLEDQRNEMAYAQLRDPKITQVVDDFIQREARGPIVNGDANPIVREFNEFSDGFRCGEVDLSSDHT